LVIFASAKFGESSLLDDLSQTINSDLPEIIDQIDSHRREKRQANATAPSGNETEPQQIDVSCVLDPLKKLQDDMRNSSALANFTEAKGNNSHQFYSVVTEQSLDSFCKLYIPRQKEISKCENSTLKLYVTDGFAIFDFICIERLDDFKRELPCLQKVDDEIQQKCTPNCTDDKDAAEKFTKMGPSNALSSVMSQDNDTLEALAHFCTHLKCLVRCQTPIVKAKCGKPAVKLIHDGVRVTFKKLNELTVATSAQDSWPKECNRIAHHNFETGKDTSPKDAGEKKDLRKRMKTITTYD